MTPRPERALVLLGGAHVHLPDHLGRIEVNGWHVAAVHDRDADRRAALCAQLGAAPLERLEDLADSGCVAAVVCSETCHHETDATAALRAGLPVFCEKPLAHGAEAAQRLAKAARAADCLLQTGFFMRTNPTLRVLRTCLRKGTLGDVQHIRVRFSHDGGFADWLDLSGWMTDPELAIYGGFVDEAVHGLDLMHWLVGPIVEASAVTGNALGWPVDDHGAGVVKFESGATGVVEAGWTDTAMRLEIDIVARDGRAWLSDGVLHLQRRGEDAPFETLPLETLDAGAGIVPFLDHLAGDPGEGLVPPEDAARINVLLDRMGLNHNALALRPDSTSEGSAP